MKTATQAPAGESLFPYSHWNAQIDSLRKRYHEASPFSHAVFENFLVPLAAEKAAGEFPDLKSSEWIHYVHVNEKKFGKTDSQTFGPTLAAIVEELNSPRFLQFLKALTGIEGLFADSTLEGGGLHQSPKGGFLNIHADFTIHPHHRDWRRRVNVLVYLNKDWQENYGGHLELWDKAMKNQVHKIAPLLNRCVIFNTDEDAYHGHPEPLTCPEGTTRKSIALYYFTKEATPPRIRSTEYKARPGDGLKGILIYCDKMILRIYDRVKRRLNLSDDFASKTLKRIESLKQKFGGKK